MPIYTANFIFKNMKNAYALNIGKNTVKYVHEKNDR